MFHITQETEHPIKAHWGGFLESSIKEWTEPTDIYMSFTNIITRKLKRGVVIFIVLTIVAGVFGKLVPGGFIPEEDMGYFYVNMQLPNAASLQRTDVISR